MCLQTQTEQEGLILSLLTSAPHSRYAQLLGQINLPSLICGRQPQQVLVSR